MQRLVPSLIAIGALAVAACGSDAKSSIDAKPASTKVVTCPGAADIKATINVNAGGTAFMPSTATIPVGGIVHFDTTAAHPVGANDNSFTINTGDGCVQFTAAGSFGFQCLVHGFTGTITVQ